MAHNRFLSPETGTTCPAPEGKRWPLPVSPRLLALFFAVIVFVLAGVGLWIWVYAVSPGPLGDEGGRPVMIPFGTAFPGIRNILEENAVIRKDRRFFYLARFFQRNQHFKAGEYLFLPGQTPLEVLRMLRDGAIARWPVTIPEGSSIYQVADILAAGQWGGREEVLRLVRDRDVLARHGIAAESLEGYLFPDTFHLVRGQSVAEIIGMMVERGRQVREKLGDLQNNELGLSVHEVLTLASIVEKETAVPEERPLVARVFLNRLQRNMRLQTDPTVVYGIEDFSGTITRSDLLRPTPYNTYVISGLPPGPIANPGRAAIEAVLNPAQSPFLYFVSKNDGSHHFSQTLEEHNRAVARYQRRK